MSAGAREVERIVLMIRDQLNAGAESVSLSRNEALFLSIAAAERIGLPVEVTFSQKDGTTRTLRTRENPEETADARRPAAGGTA